VSAAAGSDSDGPPLPPVICEVAALVTMAEDDGQVCGDLPACTGRLRGRKRVYGVLSTNTSRG